MKQQKPILLIEDDHVDVMIVKRAFKELQITNQLIVVSNGEEALDYLQNDQNTKPSIVLLDLNMPKMNGSEFLNIVKVDAQLKSIPIIVLTTSKENHDIIDSFSLQVAGYMVKPVDYKAFVEVIKVISLYWNLSELPK